MIIIYGAVVPEVNRIDECVSLIDLPCFIEREERNDENNGVDQQCDCGSPAKCRILAAMMQGVL